MDEQGEFIIENGILRFYTGSDEDVTVPEGVVALGESAFRDNRLLTSVTLPSTLREIGSGVFWGCERLESVTLPPALEVLGPWSFFGCVRLRDIAFPASLRTLGDGALQGCRALEEIVFPEGLVTMGRSVFDGCSSLRRIVFPGTLSAIGAGAFRACAALQDVVMPRVRQIGDRAFWGCRALETLPLPDALESIGDDAFYYCTALTAMRFPAGLRRIGRSAFYGCAQLSVLEIPAIAPEIGRAAFAKTPWLEAQRDGCVLAGKTLYLYKGDMPAGFTLSVPAGVERIAEYAFCGCKPLRALSLPEGVISIGESALEDCAELSSVTLPSSLNYIGKRAFRFDRALRTLSLPDAVAVLDDGAFEKCAGLRQFTLPRMLRELGRGVFAGCDALEKLLIPSDALFYKTLDGVLFTKNGKELCLYPSGKADRSYSIPEGVERISPDAFTDVRKLRILSFPASVEELPSFLFRQTPLHYARLSRHIRRLPPNVFAESTYVGFYFPELADKVTHPVYLGGPIERIAAHARAAALQGFLYASGIGEEAVKPWRSSYVESIRRNENSFARLAASNEPLLRLMIEENILTAYSTDSLLGGLIGAERTDLTAALLEYKQRRFPESTRSMFSLDDGPADPSMQADSARRRELLRSRIGLEGLRIASAGRLRKFGFYSPNGMIDMSDLRSYIRRRGGVYQSTIGKDTDCVICNDPTLVPDKIQQAAQFGVPVISEAEFLQMASERPRFNYTGI